MEWSNDKCLELIDIYEKYPVLWEPKHKFYFSKTKKNDAWDEISKIMNVDAKTVKIKMNSLLGSFRSQKSKGKKTIGTGKARQEVYISKWFAFERMHFLLDRDAPRDTLDTEKDLDTEGSGEENGEMDLSSVPVEDDSEVVIREDEDEVQVDETQEKENAKHAKPPAKKKPKKQHHEESNSLSKEALRILQDTHTRYLAKQNQDPLQDRFSIYGQHVANKLRGYSKRCHAIVEHEINNVQ
ncbi:uncharacterized protein LOC116163143 [Photinus pyralis]|uniref:uncharacterized protein LOC116163143 n=1 Tax=Photinus pyralis TaxID=7054 RepID=UPI001267292B|nr:uncharacterized protein LOC116163143 [Photinus pyralis]